MAKKRDSIILGIDIGGSGIKGARVDLVAGDLASERIKILTPQPATPEAVVAVITEIVEQAKIGSSFYTPGAAAGGLVGGTFDAVAVLGIDRTSPGIDGCGQGIDVGVWERIRNSSGNSIGYSRWGTM